MIKLSSSPSGSTISATDQPTNQQKLSVEAHCRTLQIMQPTITGSDWVAGRRQGEQGPHLCGQKFTDYNTTIWLFWVTIDCVNDKTKQTVVLLCVAATILVATVLHRNNLRSHKHKQIMSV
jgi:hypothetical protein